METSQEPSKEKLDEKSVTSKFSKEDTPATSADSSEVTEDDLDSCELAIISNLCVIYVTKSCTALLCPCRRKIR